MQQTDSTGKKSRIRGTISEGVQKLKKLNPFKHKRYEQQIFNNSESKQEEESETTTDYIWKVLNELQAQITANSQRLDNIQTQITQLQQANSQTNSQKSEDAKPKDLYKFVGNRLYYYKKEHESKGYKEFATPTTVSSATDNWNDISEIRYANDVSYDKLENPKVILYRNKDNSCYIILRIQENKHGVFYGINESHIKLGGRSFSVYDVSEDMGSFTDGVARMIYVDESGLYFVPVAGNSVEDVIDSYQKGGKFNFKGSVIKVSAIDGTIIWNGNTITKDNFFDNWVLENGKTILSTNQPKSNEILRNFYPPNGRYKGIYFQKVKNERGEYRTESMNSYREGISWLNSFVNKRLSLTKATNKNGAEELVRDGTFASILSLPKELFTPSGSMFGSDLVYYQKVYDAVAAQIVAAKKEQPQTGFSLGSSNSAIPKSISDWVSQNPTLFRNPEFVKRLKSAFAAIEKDYEHNKESELWIPFEIVRNL